MRARVVGWLRGLAGWLERPDARMLHLYVPVDALLERARVVCEEAAQNAAWGNGEKRRHVVYAQLMKEFPTRKKRAIALAIEAAL